MLEAVYNGVPSLAIDRLWRCMRATPRLVTELLCQMTSGPASLQALPGSCELLGHCRMKCCEARQGRSGSRYRLQQSLPRRHDAGGLSELRQDVLASNDPPAVVSAVRPHAPTRLYALLEVVPTG